MYAHRTAYAGTSPLVAPPASRPRPWLARVGWAALAVAACALLALAFGRAWVDGDAARNAGRAAAVSTSGYEVITVEPGDTLWDIAGQRYPGSDVRARVFEIEQANGLSGPVIVEGQRLQVPRR
jgi:LysM domain